MVLKFWFRALGLGTLLITSCKSPADRQSALSILWENGKPVAIIVPFQTDKDFLLVTIAKDSAVPVLGEWTIHNDSTFFRPLIPLTRGMKYEVSSRDKKLGEIEIPFPDSKQTAVVTGIYPSNDTVPENLLKIYVEFSKPMMEGNAIENFLLIKNDKDTLHNVFLDLQTELWNNAHDRLTIWLDPGRIKRDLQPNQTLGNPLNKGNRYRFIVGSTLSDAEGISLGKNYQKEFVVAGRDSTTPDPEKWYLHTPKASSNEALRIGLNEPLDYVLLNNAIRIVDEKGAVVEGKISTGDEERILYFRPTSAWQTKNYFLEIESRLEDLAGNNLNHPFDRDITVREIRKPQEVYRKKFAVK